MGIFNGILSSLPPISINGQNLPPWMELVGLGLIIVLILMSLLPRLMGESGRLRNIPGMNSPPDMTDITPGQDYR